MEDTFELSCLKTRMRFVDELLKATYGRKPTPKEVQDFWTNVETLRLNTLAGKV